MTPRFFFDWWLLNARKNPTCTLNQRAPRAGMGYPQKLQEQNPEKKKTEFSSMAVELCGKDWRYTVMR
jgi:hypothetical protein